MTFCVTLSYAMEFDLPEFYEIRSIEHPLHILNVPYPTKSHFIHIVQFPIQNIPLATYASELFDLLGGILVV